jgi:DNA-binding transcriptional ArsR family regulator
MVHGSDRLGPVLQGGEVCQPFECAGERRLRVPVLSDAAIASSVQVHQALSDATRLRLLALLDANGEACVCELLSALEMPQSTVSHHLRVLLSAGLVRLRKQGRWALYSVDPATLSRLDPFFSERALT